ARGAPTPGRPQRPGRGGDRGSGSGGGLGADDRPVRLSRRGLIGALGAIWFLDGCLQLQPHMLTQAFFVSTFENANVSLPSWLTGVEVHLDTWTGAHPLPWDLGIAAIQLAIGAALLAGRWVRPALGVSVLWGVAVWVFG